MNNANLKLAAIPADQNSGVKAIELKDQGNEVIGWVEVDCEFKPSKKSGTISPAEFRTILMVMENFNFFYDNLMKNQ